MYINTCTCRKDNDLLPLPYFRSLSRLPIENQIFLQYLMPLLHYISINEEINCMNSINLAICFAPSILWPDSGLDVIKNEVPPLVQFMVEHTPQIFGSDLPELYKQAKLPSGSSLVESMEYSLDPQVRYVPTKVEDGSHRFGTDGQTAWRRLQLATNRREKRSPYRTCVRLAAAESRSAIPSSRRSRSTTAMSTTAGLGQWSSAGSTYCNSRRSRQIVRRPTPSPPPKE